MKIDAQCVLFDLDGTLVDTAPDLIGALNRLRTEQELPPLPEPQLRPMASLGAAGLLKAGLNLQADQAGFEEARERFLTLYARHIADRSRVFDGLTELLDTLKQQGRHWGVVTNKPGYLTWPLLRALDLEEKAVSIVAGDCAGVAKPDPAPMRLALQRSGMPVEHCVMVGDDRRDIVAAQAVGMRSVAVGWGYHPSEDPPQTWAADAYAETPADLRLLLG